MSTGNAYCDALGLAVPSVEEVAQNARPNHYVLLIAVLLERGGPVTFDDAVARIAQARRERPCDVRAALKRHALGIPPIRRYEGGYELVPDNPRLDYWLHYLGLRGPAAFAQRSGKRGPKRLPVQDLQPYQRLSMDELEEACQRGVLARLSPARQVICVLDAQGCAMKAEDVVAYVTERTGQTRLTTESGAQWREKAAICVQPDGLWTLRVGNSTVRSTRCLVRTQIQIRRRACQREQEPGADATECEEPADGPVD